MKKLKVVDLFSGIGGFSFGLESTGFFETVAFCEIDQHATSILNKHWPEIKVQDDVRTIEFTGEVDVVTGGFPCQDLSTAGLRKGIIAGERSSLWGEMLRLIGRLRPKYAVIENVTGLLTGESGRWFARLLSDLASIGYDAEWHRISAADIGASHCRERVWIIAYPSKIGRTQSIIKRYPAHRRDVGEVLFHYTDIQGIVSWAKGEREEFKGLRGKPIRHREDDGISDWMDRVARCGNSIVPQIAEFIGYEIAREEGLFNPQNPTPQDRQSPHSP